jgi:hypothetical protein
MMYCCYCLEPQGDKFHCCQENHFVTFDELDFDQQEIVIEDEKFCIKNAPVKEDSRP